MAARRITQEIPQLPWRKYIRVALVLVLTVGLCIWAIVWLKTPTISEDDARPIAEAFLTDVRTGRIDRIDAAWDGTTPEFKSNQGREQFRKYVKTQKRLAETAQFQSAQMSEANGVRVAECLFLTPQGPVRVLLARDENKWKVERILVD